MNVPNAADIFILVSAVVGFACCAYTKPTSVKQDPLSVFIPSAEAVPDKEALLTVIPDTATVFKVTGFTGCNICTVNEAVQELSSVTVTV
ncbi:hypothetical protein D3C87_1768550 [compost metagenome]